MGRFGQKRIGLLTPAGNTTMEDDFARWMPASVKATRQPAVHRFAG